MQTPTLPQPTVPEHPGGAGCRAAPRDPLPARAGDASPRPALRRGSCFGCGGCALGAPRFPGSRAQQLCKTAAFQAVNGTSHAPGSATELLGAGSPPEKAAEISGISYVGKKGSGGTHRCKPLPGAPCARSVLPQASSPASLPGDAAAARPSPSTPNSLLRCISLHFLLLLHMPEGLRGRSQDGRRGIPPLPPKIPSRPGHDASPLAGRDHAGQTDALRGWSKQAAAQDGLKERKEKKTKNKPPNQTKATKEAVGYRLCRNQGVGIVRGGHRRQHQRVGEKLHEKRGCGRPGATRARHGGRHQFHTQRSKPLSPVATEVWRSFMKD